ncbi:MAG: glycosyl transferase family 1 [Methylococcaceae bacterium]|nr:glycosyl transferase family 1 [Methylococcaceae bacterium]
MSSLPGHKRPRIVFFSEAVSLAHLARPLVLAKALRETGRYDVFFASADRYAVCFEGADFHRLAIESLAPGDFLRALERGQPIYDTSRLEAYVRQDLAVIDEVRPDLIVGDFRLSLAVSAPLRNVPYAAIANAYWSPYSARRRFPIPDLPMTRWLGADLCQPLFDFLQPLIFGLHARPLNRVRKRHGLPALNGLLEVYTHADQVLYADIPSLAPTTMLPPHHRYLGPIIWSPESSLPSWWNEPDPALPCIYISLGSSGRADLLPAIVESLADVRANLLVATAGRFHFDSLPSNAWAAEFLPGSLAAARSDLTLCNGGSPTVQQVLAEGKPVLGIASNMDQYLAMEEVCRLQAGCLIRSIDASGARVREVVTSMLGDGRYLDGAKNLQKEMAAMNPKRRFCEFVEQFFSGQ